MNLTILLFWIFGVRFYGGSELSKHLKMLATDVINAKKIYIYFFFLNRTRSEFFLTDENFGGSV